VLKLQVIVQSLDSQAASLSVCVMLACGVVTSCCRAACRHEDGLCRLEEAAGPRGPNCIPEGGDCLGHGASPLAGCELQAGAPGSTWRTGHCFCHSDVLLCLRQGCSHLSVEVQLWRACYHAICCVLQERLLTERIHTWYAQERCQVCLGV